MKNLWRLSKGVWCEPHIRAWCAPSFSQRWERREVFCSSVLASETCKCRHQGESILSLSFTCGGKRKCSSPSQHTHLQTLASRGHNGGAPFFTACIGDLRKASSFSPPTFSIGWKGQEPFPLTLGNVSNRSNKNYLSLGSWTWQWPELGAICRPPRTSLKITNGRQTKCHQPLILLGCC